MLSFILFLVACGTVSRAQDGEIIVPDGNKTLCINQMQEWCDNMQYPQQGVGLAILSISYEDPNAYYRVFCSSDSDGTNCTRNREPWFTCSPDHVLTYKGKILTNTSTDVDKDICETADKAFNELFIQNLSYDNTSIKNEIQKGMEAFFEQMTAMEEEIAYIQNLLSRIIPSISGVGSDIWRDFSKGFMLQESPSSADSTTPDTGIDNIYQNSTEETLNQIDKA